MAGSISAIYLSCWIWIARHWRRFPDALALIGVSPAQFLCRLDAAFGFS
jgi:hypothetical protein